MEQNPQPQGRWARLKEWFRLNFTGEACVAYDMSGYDPNDPNFEFVRFRGAQTPEEIENLREGIHIVIAEMRTEELMDDLRRHGIG